MDWEKYIQGMFTGGLFAEVRSIRFRDESGCWRRYRVCSSDAGGEKFTKRAARARLVKDEGGKIGVAIHPGGSGFVKVGKNLSLQSVIFVPVGAISKKPLEKLLKQVDCVIYENDGCNEAYEE